MIDPLLFRFFNNLWRVLTKKRFGTFLACLLIPECIVYRVVITNTLTTKQKALWAVTGAALGIAAFAFLCAKDWLQDTIITRELRNESTIKLKLAQWFLFLFVLPAFLFIVLLVVVIKFL
jgi:hypothetical protein